MTREQQMMVRFLTKEVIKSISKETWKNELWAKIKENRQDKSKSTRMDDAIWKAHRDVMTGARTCNIPKYSAFSTGTKLKEEGKSIIIDLTKICEDALNKNTPIGTDYLLKELTKDPRNGNNVEFGALQKLINMTLKYFIILRSFGEKDVPKVDLQHCDCPLDRKILEKLHDEFQNNELVCDIDKKKPLSWTKIECKDKYKKIQGLIDEYFENDKEQMPFGRLTFDFIHW